MIIIKSEEDIFENLSKLKKQVKPIADIIISSKLEIRKVKRKPIWLSQKFEDFSKIKSFAKKYKYEYTGKLYHLGKPLREFGEHIKIEEYGNKTADIKIRITKEYKNLV